MIVKVCGLRTEENLKGVTDSYAMVGLNFYMPSIRCVALDAEAYDILPATVKRVGVFVNESQEEILNKVSIFGLDYVQLHGDESVDFGREISKHAQVIKVFRISSAEDLQNIAVHDYAEYYLFDTYTEAFGGSGKKFDWNVLNNYTGDIPFLLSGGIGLEDTSRILSISHPMFRGVDINSKFESSPAIKDMNMIDRFIEEVIQ